MLRMPFGRFRGALLQDLPQDYLEWLATVELRQPLRSAVKAERLRRAGTYHDEFSQEFEYRLTGADRKIARQIVENGRRALAKISHPDLGGDHAVMQRINVVADAMLENL